MKNAQLRPVRSKFPFTFHSIRNITSPEDEKNDRKIYVGQAPLSSIISLPTNENVRDYLVEAEGKKRRVPTQVHRAIFETLNNNPDNFSILNSGVVIVARNCQIDDNKKTVILDNPSIINGSQTQGVVKDFFEKNENINEFPYHIKFEIVVTNDEGLIADISIARNFQNDVMTISIIGRLGYLDELEKKIQEEDPYIKLKKSETKLSDDYVKTEKLIQVISALIPDELWTVKSTEFNKVYTYSQKTKCLKEFQEVYENAKKGHEQYKNLYHFYIDIAPQALEIYDKWKSHQGFIGTRLKAIKRDETKRKIEEVPDGIIFPIIASLAAFAVHTPSGWRIIPPKSFDEGELIKSASAVYQEIADSNPQTMGKSKACYSALYQITSLYRKLTK
ncbi:MAG: AIPR family protein [Desulfobulbaceae bacterium]|nr:AIPR family protein [Desulfobulbaceae bacterium]